MARTAYNEPQAESIYQHGAGNDNRMPDALQNLPYGKDSGHDQKVSKKTGKAGK